MISFFRNLDFNQTSFWLGFIAGFFFFALFILFQRNFPKLLQYIRARIQSYRDQLSISTEIRLKNDLYRYVQRKHLASDLFSLDEVAIEPRFMVIPQYSSNSKQGITPDISLQVIPYMPDFPEVATSFHAPTLSIQDALAGGANLLITGKPGAGKTFCLAYIASLITKHQDNSTEHSGIIPLFIEAPDLLKKTMESVNLAENVVKTEVDITIDLVAKYASTLTLPRLPILLKNAFETGKVIIFLDGLDEMTRESHNQAVIFLTNMISKHPRIRLIVTDSSESYHGLPALDFIPLALVPWDEVTRAAFVQKWSQLWQKFVTPQSTKEFTNVDNKLIQSWLVREKLPTTPFEESLMVWSTLAGDLLSPDLPKLIETHLRRLTYQIPNSSPLLEELSNYLLVNQATVFNQTQAEQWLSNTQLQQGKKSLADINPLTSPNPEQEKININQTVNLLLSQGVLKARSDGQLSFLHPLFFAYLLAKYVVKNNTLDQLDIQSEWSGLINTFQFIAYFGDPSPIIDQMLIEDDFKYQKLLLLSQWIPNAPKDASWRVKILRPLATGFQKELITSGISARLMAALALSGDSGVIALFRQLTKSEHAILRQYAALGCGLIRDPKANTDLTALINDPVNDVVKAAFLALISIGDKNALEITATALLQGNEFIRQTAAETLANHSQEGHPALDEGSKMDDLMVRRAVVFGLKRVNLPWAIKILEQMQLEDKQWIVRNAAIQALEEINQPNPNIPKSLPPLTDTEWLINFAAKLGMGVSPGKPALDLLIQALNDGEEEERIAALDYLKYKGDATILPVINQVYQSNLGIIREAAFNTLYSLSAAGIKS